mgnify:CR=1 FL=1
MSAWADSRLTGYCPDEYVIEMVIAALRAENGVQARAAKRLGVSRANPTRRIEDLDRVASLRCRSSFLGRGGLTTASLLEDARFHASAKRTLRLLLAVHTTHPDIEKAWSSLMRSIATRMTECKLAQLAKYQALSNVDKVAIRDNEDMMSYIAGIESR